MVVGCTFRREAWAAPQCGLLAGMEHAHHAIAPELDLEIRRATLRLRARALFMLARNGGSCARPARRYAVAMPQPAWEAAFLRNGWLIVSRHPARAHSIRLAVLLPRLLTKLSQ